MKNAVVVMGPTAVGKSGVAVGVAARIGSEVVSADSMQIYRGLDIGAAKPSAELLARVPHHMIGVADPARPYSVAEYREAAGRAISDILGRGKVPVVAGGAGLYIHALVYDMDLGGAKGDEAVRAEYERLAAKRGRGYLHDLLAGKNPVAAEKIHPNNLRRVIRALERVGAEVGQGVAPQGEPAMEGGGMDGTYKPFGFDLRKGNLVEPDMFLLTRERADLVRRIDERVEDMVRGGLVEEVESLARQGLTLKHISMLGIGYKETLGYLNRDYGLDEMTELIKIHTRRYAKRQMTWFKRYEGAQVIDLTEMDEGEAAKEIVEGVSRGRIARH